MRGERGEDEEPLLEEEEGKQKKGRIPAISGVAQSVT